MKKNVAVIGSSGAIGNAVSKILLDDESVDSVYNFSRSISPNISDKENRIYIDIESEESIKDAVKNDVIIWVANIVPLALISPEAVILATVKLPLELILPCTLIPLAWIIDHLARTEPK